MPDTAKPAVINCCFAIPIDYGQRILTLVSIVNAIAEVVMVGVNYDMGRQIWCYIVTTTASVYLAIRYVIWFKDDNEKNRR